LTRDRVPYSRVYWSVVDDPKFEAVYADNNHLATWLRLLIAADAIWPASASLPVTARKASVTALVDAELVDILTGGRYRIRGLDAERTRRSRSKNDSGDDEPPAPSQLGPKSPHGPRPTEPSHAGAPRLGSSLLGSSPTEGVQGEADAFDTWMRLTGSWPSDRIRPWLNQLIEDHGDAAVSDAVAVEWATDSTRHTVLGRARDRLEREAHEASKRRQAAEANAAADERKRMNSMPEEQRAANLARLRDEMARVGLLSPPAKRTDA
jgi:hypothetical protein